MSERPTTSIGCLYIAPLKALINDQYRRLTDLCEDQDIPIWRWHGDVSQSQKRRMLKQPRGVLQITPESLESFMINKHMDIPNLFHDLRYIVIDELHSFLRSDRGGQSFCLIERLSKLAGVDPRRIGLWEQGFHIKQWRQRSKIRVRSGDYRWNTFIRWGHKPPKIRMKIIN